MAERYVQFSAIHYRILDQMSPNDPITVVAPMKADLDPHIIEAYSRALRSDRTMSVRLPRSWIERQISGELDRPITTAAILGEDRKGTKNFDEAFDIVVGGMVRTGIERRLCAIKHPTIRAGALSTVIGVGARNDRGASGIVIHREGDTSLRKITQVVGRLTPRDFEDWT